MSLFDLSGRIALVTGSSRGIGYALARGLADAGATIVLNGVSQSRLAQARAQLREEFGDTRVHAYAFDVTDAERVDDSVARIESEVGPIEILVNNAALQHRQPLLDVTVEDWKRVIDTDLTSAFLVGRAVARFQIGARERKIVNVCSVQSDLARPTIAPYTTAKGGLRNLTRAMTAEWAASGLQINGLAPGYIHTGVTQALVDDAQFDSWLRGRAPAGRWGTPDDLVGPAVWLASDASRYVNGQVIFVDGGMTAVV